MQHTYQLIADSDGKVSPDFRRSIVERYLTFVLSVGWCPSEVYHGGGAPDPEKLEEWRDLFLREIKDKFVGASVESISALRDAFDLLDPAKCYMLDGAHWLEKELFS